MYLKPLAVIALACLLSGCACTTRPSALPVPIIAPDVKAPPPAALMILPVPPEPLDTLATPEDVLAHVRDYGGYCRKLEAGYRGLADYIKDTP